MSEKLKMLLTPEQFNSIYSDAMGILIHAHIDSRISHLNNELQKTREQLVGVTDQLDKAEKVIEFYGNWINWKEAERDEYEYGTAIILHSDYTLENCCWSGGRRARQYFKDKDKQGEG